MSTESDGKIIALDGHAWFSRLQDRMHVAWRPHAV
jgi:hypothetical protein